MKQFEYNEEVRYIGKTKHLKGLIGKVGWHRPWSHRITVYFKYAEVMTNLESLRYCPSYYTVSIKDTNVRRVKDEVMFIARRSRK